LPEAIGFAEEPFNVEVQVLPVVLVLLVLVPPVVVTDPPVEAPLP
jgi:hypothetical protein